MSGAELTELLDQVEGAIRDFSEELVQQLARRDELEFEKEVKNSFITVLIEVQNKQKEQRELMKKRRKEKGLSLQSGRVDKGSQMPLKVREPVCPTSNPALQVPVPQPCHGQEQISPEQGLMGGTLADEGRRGCEKGEKMQLCPPLPSPRGLRCNWRRPGVNVRK